MTNNTKNFLGRYWHWFFIAIAIVVSLYIRIVNPWDSVFTWTVRLSGNDPWYYYRIIQSLLTHFPERIWFDAFTNYPYGTGTHFGPFVVYLGAILAKLGGATTPEALRGVLAFVPTIGGTLLVFPAYLLTKELFNKKAGVIAALLIIMVPGQLLHRSVLSFNDHHIWEVLWMITTLALFAYSVNKWSSKSAMENLKSNSVIAPVFTGLAIGLYLYSWAPGFIVVLILTLYVLVAYILKDWINIRAENIAFIGIVAFLTAAIVYLPFAFQEPGFSFARYSPFQLLILLGVTGVMAVFYGIGELEKRGYYQRLGIKEQYAFPATIVVLGMIIFALMSVLASSFVERITSILGVVQKTGGALTVAEIQPFFTMRGGQFSLFPAWSTFATTFFFAIPGIIYTAIRFILKERNNLYLLAVVWGVAMLIALAGQNRFAYYFGAVSAIFAAIMLDAILRYLNFYEAVTGGIERLKKVGYIRLAVSILIIIAVFYPTFTMAYEQSKYAGGGMNKQWFDTLTWMRTNTPNQEFYDQYYNEVYEPN
ncbi:MAG: STT3 domain-containing protein, partial [Archaeoglobaceae archaeon]